MASLAALIKKWERQDHRREYSRQWAANRRAAWFADKRCVICGSTEDLELDHIDAGTKGSHRIWSWSEARRDAEIAKCQVLCQRCHRYKTMVNGELPHKLTPDDVRAIRAMAGAHSHAEIADRFGVHRRTIHKVLTGETYSYVE